MAEDNRRSCGGSGGATYRGLEFEGMVNVACGAPLYAKYSLDCADLKSSGGPLSVTPRYAGAAGVPYQRSGVFRADDLIHNSAIGKFVGP